jgi:hypothetical protein
MTDTYQEKAGGRRHGAVTSDDQAHTTRIDAKATGAEIVMKMSLRPGRAVAKQTMLRGCAWSDYCPRRPL